MIHLHSPSGWDFAFPQSFSSHCWLPARQKSAWQGSTQNPCTQGWSLNRITNYKHSKSFSLKKTPLSSTVLWAHPPTRSILLSHACLVTNCHRSSLSPLQTANSQLHQPTAVTMVSFFSYSCDAVKNACLKPLKIFPCMDCGPDLVFSLLVDLLEHQTWGIAIPQEHPRMVPEG